MAENAYVRFELKSSKPVDLLNLTGALRAFGDASDLEDVQDNIRLFVREVRSRSIIADLISLVCRASFVVNHKEAIAQFAAHLKLRNEIDSCLEGVTPYA
jgi:hypothetical protein